MTMMMTMHSHAATKIGVETCVQNSGRRYAAAAAGPGGSTTKDHRIPGKIYQWQTGDGCRVAAGHHRMSEYSVQQRRARSRHRYQTFLVHVVRVFEYVQFGDHLVHVARSRRTWDLVWSLGECHVHYLATTCPRHDYYLRREVLRFVVSVGGCVCVRSLSPIHTADADATRLNSTVESRRRSVLDIPHPTGWVCTWVGFGMSCVRVRRVSVETPAGWLGFRAHAPTN